MRRTIVLIAIVAIVAGSAARFWDLETRTFWVDEAFSALRISGHTYADVTALFDGHVHEAAQVASMQETPQGLGATISSILNEEPQRGLVYYVAAALWSDVFGTTVAAERAFSAVLGTLGIGLALLLGWRATRSALGGLVLAALVALSPFQVAYSQQAREYVLFADCILLAAWLLLGALEAPSGLRWAAFGLASILGLYVEPLFVFVLLAAAVVVAFERPFERAKAGGFAIAAAIALAIFVPLAVVNLQATARAELGVSWAGTPYALPAYLVKWLFNIGATFFDAELANRWWALALVPLLSVVACALAYAVRSARGGDRPARLALALLGCTSLPFILADLVKHAHYEAVTRYQVATWIGLELAVALALAEALRSNDARSRLWSSIAFTFVLACGATSIFVSRPYALWWENNQTVDSAAVALAVPSHPTPTIIAQRPVAVDVLAFARYVAPRDRFLLVGNGPELIDARDEPFYLFLPDASMKGLLAAAEDCFHHCRRRAGTREASRRVHGMVVNISPAVRSAVPSLARDSQLSDPKNALWKWDSGL